MIQLRVLAVLPERRTDARSQQLFRALVDAHTVELATTDVSDDGAEVLTHRFALRPGATASPDLLEFLHAEGATFDAVVFAPYAHIATASGLPLVPDRALLVPLARDGDPIEDRAALRAVFHLPRAIGYASTGERERARRAYRNEQVPAEILPFEQGDLAERVGRFVWLVRA